MTTGSRRHVECTAIRAVDPIRRLALVMGACAGLAVVLTLDGPGLTIDEPLDVRPGPDLYQGHSRARACGFLIRRWSTAFFEDNAEHPPLGRWLLGIASTLGEPFEVIWKGPDPTGQYVLAGRLAPAAAFAVLVGVVTARRRPPLGLAAPAQRPALHCWRCPASSPTPTWRRSIRS